jgi:hypothetical protein
MIGVGFVAAWGEGLRIARLVEVVDRLLKGFQPSTTVSGP